MRSLHSALDRAGISITESVYGNTWRFDKEMPRWSSKAFEDADLIVVNGEGTMHDNSRMSRFLIDQVMQQAGSRKIALVNSLWQNMPDQDHALLARLDLLCAREPGSAAQMNVPGVITMPDLSFYDIPQVSTLPQAGMIKGTFYRKAHVDCELDGSINIARQDWSTIVNILRQSDALFTGKHHEVYAACVARCPFVVSAIDTHKVAALGDLIGRPIPSVAKDANTAAIRAALKQAQADADGTFALLFDRLEELRAAHDLSTMFKALI